MKRPCAARGAHSLARSAAEMIRRRRSRGVAHGRRGHLTCALWVAGCGLRRGGGEWESEGVGRRARVEWPGMAQMAQSTTHHAPRTRTLLTERRRRAEDGWRAAGCGQEQPSGRALSPGQPRLASRRLSSALPSRTPFVHLPSPSHVSPAIMHAVGPWALHALHVSLPLQPCPRQHVLSRALPCPPVPSRAVRCFSHLPMFSFVGLVCLVCLAAQPAPGPLSLLTAPPPSRHDQLSTELDRSRSSSDIMDKERHVPSP